MMNREWVKENVRFGQDNTNFAKEIFNVYDEFEKVMNRKSRKLTEAEKNGIEVLKEIVKKLEERA